MIIVDNALRAREAEGRPIRVGMIGAGFMAQGLTNQIANSVPGMRDGGDLRPPPRAGRGRLPLRRQLEDVVIASTTQAEFEDAVRAGRVRWSPTTRSLLCRSEHIDVIVDVTGSVEFGAQRRAGGVRARQARRRR